MRATVTFEIDEADLAKLITDPPRGIVLTNASWTVPIVRMTGYNGPHSHMNYVTGIMPCNEVTLEG